MATTNNIWKDLVIIVADHLGLPTETIHEDSSFIDDLGADTLDIVELIMETESYFSIEITEDEAEHCNTVGHLHKLLTSKKGEIQK